MSYYCSKNETGHTMIPKDNKKRHVVSIENMSPALAEVFNELYPRGFSDYLDDLVRYTKPDGTPFYAVTVETPDSIYLVKVKVKTDDVEDIERWLEGDEDDDNDQIGGSAGSGEDGGTPLPDDNISQYGSDEDSAE